MVDEVATIAEETTAEAETVAASAEEQTSALTAVSESADDLSQQAVALSEALDRFETDADGIDEAVDPLAAVPDSGTDAGGSEPAENTDRTASEEDGDGTRSNGGAERGVTDAEDAAFTFGDEPSTTADRHESGEDD